MKIIKAVQISLVSLGIGILLTGCTSEKEGSAKADTSDTRKVKVAYVQSSKPMTYTDDNGNATGYDVEVLKAVDELLPEYEFDFIGTSDDDLLVGVEQGKYQVGVKNAFWTEERTAKFIYPEEFIGLSSTGLVLQKKNESIKSLTDFATAGYSLAPIAANNAQYAVIEEHNEKHPDNPVNLQAGDTFSIDVVQWVNEGRVDGAVIIEASFDRQVSDPEGPHYRLKNDVVYNEFAVIKTWPLFNKKQQQFADAYDQAITELKETDALRELTVEFYGKDLFEVLDSVKR